MTHLAFLRRELLSPQGSQKLPQSVATGPCWGPAPPRPPQAWPPGDPASGRIRKPQKQGLLPAVRPWQGARGRQLAGGAGAGQASAAAAVRAPGTGTQVPADGSRAQRLKSGGATLQACAVLGGGRLLERAAGWSWGRLGALTCADATEFQKSEPAWKTATWPLPSRFRGALGLPHLPWGP